MLRIAKGPEPACLVALRTTPGASWASVSGAQRAEIGAQLFDERGVSLQALVRRYTDPDAQGVLPEYAGVGRTFAERWLRADQKRRRALTAQRRRGR